MIIPKFNITTPIKKINWQPVAQYDPRTIFSNTSIPHDKLGTVNVSIEKLQEFAGKNRFIISVKNIFNKILGREQISIHPDDKTITGFSIYVEPDYRQNGYRIGEILRLFSVMEMVENKKTNFEIFSKDSAVYFHSKYKFQPDNHLFKHRDEMLKNIANDFSHGFEKFAQKAKELLKLVEDPKTTDVQHRELCLKANELTKEYIQAALKDAQPENSHPFYYGFDMTLTKENIDKNKDFYNGLFKKYGIDYTI